MTAKFIDIKIEDGAVHEAFSRLLERAEDLAPLMRELSEILYDQTMENFEQEGRPHWTSLAPSTIRQRAKEGHWPGKMLQRSGVLKAAVSPFATRDTAMVRVALPYAAIQQLGGVIERAAYGGTVRLRTNARGELLRQGKAGRGKNLAVFAKDKHRRAKTIRYEAGGFTIRIPPRPYLPVTAAGELQPEAEAEILEALADYLEGAGRA